MNVNANGMGWVVGMTVTVNYDNGSSYVGRVHSVNETSVLLENGTRSDGTSFDWRRFKFDRMVDEG